MNKIKKYYKFYLSFNLIFVYKFNMLITDLNMYILYKSFAQ